MYNWIIMATITKTTTTITTSTANIKWKWTQSLNIRLSETAQFLDFLYFVMFEFVRSNHSCRTSVQHTDDVVLFLTLSLSFFIFSAVSITNTKILIIFSSLIINFSNHRKSWIFQQFFECIHVCPGQSVRMVDLFI